MCCVRNDEICLPYLDFIIGLGVVSVHVLLFIHLLR